MKKKATIETIQREILGKSLPNVPFDGWTQEVLWRAAGESNYSQELIDTAFSSGVRDLVLEFTRYIDEQMVESLNKVDAQDMRVRDKIKTGVQARLTALETHREAERLAVGFWALPSQSRHGLKSLWRTADLIWDFAGDTATDYNRYTKRALLSGVLSKTILYWLQDTSENYQETDEFLDRQIDRVLTMGKTMGRAKGALDYVWSKVAK